jgi:hypothetical protein
MWEILSYKSIIQNFLSLPIFEPRTFYCYTNQLSITGVGKERRGHGLQFGNILSIARGTEEDNRKH